MNELERMELKISKFLRVGVLISGITIAAGWIWSFDPNADPFANLQTYRPLNLMDSFEISFMLQYWGRMLCYLGLFFLISLPVIRVLLSILLFIKQKEKAMALIGAIVLVGLILSFSLGTEG